MAQTSKKWLDKKTQDRIFATFSEFFSSHLGKDSSGNILSEFLTPTEKIYLTKRFMAAYFIIKEIDYRTISKTLRISTTTISSVATRLETEEKHMLKELQKFFAKREKSNSALSELFESFTTDFSKHPGAYQKKLHSLEHEQS